MDINSTGRRNSWMLKAIAILTLIPFAFSVPAQAQLITPVTQISNPSAIELKNVVVPHEFGKIQETYTSSHQSPTVILIQDAHAIPDAQRSILKLIGLFQKKYGIDLVALEGASSDLDPQILRSFPDQQLLHKVLEQYSERGELAGTTAAAILNKEQATYHGIEDWDLYEEGLRYFLDTMQYSGPGCLDRFLFGF